LVELSLAGKVAVVTGGASGIEKAVACSFAAAGAKVSLVDIDGAAADKAAEEIKQLGGCVRVFQCDVTDQARVDSLFAQLAADGPIDALVNSAGIAHVGTIANTDVGEFERVFVVNVKGTYLCMKAALRHMVDQGYGTIVNLASVAATAGIPDRFAYSMSKGAVLSMTLSVAKDFLERNIRCNCISPARVHTPFVDGFLHRSYPGREKEMFSKLARAQPIGRMARPEEVATMVLFLCSEWSGFLTGANIPFDGGFIHLRS
jgi:2-keto-3-deoxy-L-fuconate dehydrogenase